MAVGPDPQVTIVRHPVGGVELQAWQPGVVGIDPVGDQPASLRDPPMAADRYVGGRDADSPLSEVRAEALRDALLRFLGRRHRWLVSLGLHALTALVARIVWFPNHSARVTRKQVSVESPRS